MGTQRIWVEMQEKQVISVAIQEIRKIRMEMQEVRLEIQESTWKLIAVEIDIEQIAVEMRKLNNGEHSK